MSKLLLASLTSLALMAFAGSAYAVDIQNQDKLSHEIQIDDPNATEKAFIEVLHGETVTDICKSCDLTIGDSDAVAAEGDQIAMIKNGILIIETK